jgi:hypothetical protein
MNIRELRINYINRRLIKLQEKVYQRRRKDLKLAIDILSDDSFSVLEAPNLRKKGPVLIDIDPVTGEPLKDIVVLPDHLTYLRVGQFLTDYRSKQQDELDINELIELDCLLRIFR